MEGIERAGAAEDRYGKTQHLSSPDQRGSVRSMCVRAGEGDSRAFSFPMHAMHSLPNGDALMYRNTLEQHIFLPRRKKPTDDKLWMPNLTAVRATIRFAIATG